MKVTPRTVQIDPLTIRAAVKSVDADRRTAELILSTGARVLRNGWDGPYYEELSLEKKHVRMKRINNGAPLLNSHGTSFGGPTLEDQIGIVEKASLTDDAMTGVVRFARAEDDPKADMAFRKVQDGIIRNVSLGYRVYRLEKVEQTAGQPPVFRATDWEPYEASLVPMGADDGAKVRAEGVQTNTCQVVDVTTRKESKMDPINGDVDLSAYVPETPVAADPAAPAPVATAIAPAPAEPNERDAGAVQERERVQGILLATRAARLPQVVADGLIRDGVKLVDAQRAIFVELAKRDVNPGVPRQGGSQVQVIGDDPLVHVRRGIENAVLHRVAPIHFKLEEVGKPYRGMTLLDVARSYLNARQIRTTGFSKMELAAAALGLDTRGGMHTTSDFATLLADVASKTLRAAYDTAPQTFTAIARRTTLPDFKPANRVQIGDAPSLVEVKEHGEFTRGTIGEGKEVFQLLTYGRVFAITRKALVNDDTDSFSRVSTMFGRSARNLESDLVWAQITSNPVMGDGVALFHATHKNLDAVPSAISVASLGKARAAMRLQTGLDGATLLNLTPKTLVVPPSLETVAAQFLAVVTPAQPSNSNPFQGLLTPLAEPRLEANSATAWYLVASGDQIDIIEYAYLEGEEGPVVESRIGFDVDGLEVKCRHDFAAKVIDHRGLYKNPGV